MVHSNGYVAGWLNTSIADFLSALPRNSDSAAYALITCLDSDPDPASILKNDPDLVAANGIHALKKGVVLPSKLLHKASLRSRLFVGFDEIWFFPTPEIQPKPPSASIVGPKRIDQQTLDLLAHWMDQNGCSLAVGDGGGLNVIVKAYGLVKYVIGQTLFQAGPTFQMSDLWVQDEEKKSPAAKRRGRRAVEKT
jgi:hypothetical protein